MKIVTQTREQVGHTWVALINAETGDILAELITPTITTC